MVFSKKQFLGCVSVLDFSKHLSITYGEAWEHPMESFDARYNTEPNMFERMCEADGKCSEETMKSLRKMEIHDLIEIYDAFERFNSDDYWSSQEAWKSQFTWIKNLRSEIEEILRRIFFTKNQFMGCSPVLLFAKYEGKTYGQTWMDNIVSFRHNLHTIPVIFSMMYRSDGNISEQALVSLNKLSNNDLKEIHAHFEILSEKDDWSERDSWRPLFNWVLNLRSEIQIILNANKTARTACHVDAEHICMRCGMSIR